MTIPEYISALNKLYKAGIATEHSYRGDLKILIESLVAGIAVTNEPAHIACGAPDYILTRRNNPIGYIEAKDINKPLDGKEYKEQFDHYRNLLLKSFKKIYILDLHGNAKKKEVCPDGSPD